MPLFQSESKCETILMKMTFICMKKKLHAELVFIWKVSHLGLLWNRGTRELGDGLLLRRHLVMRRNRLAQSSWNRYRWLIGLLTISIYVMSAFNALKSLFCFFVSFGFFLFSFQFYYVFIFTFYKFVLALKWGGGLKPSPRLRRPWPQLHLRLNQLVCRCVTHRIPVCSLWHCSAELLFEVVIFPFTFVQHSKSVSDACRESVESRSGEMEPSETFRNPSTYEINTLQHGNCFVRFLFTSWEV